MSVIYCCPAKTSHFPQFRGPTRPSHSSSVPRGLANVPHMAAGVQLRLGRPGESLIFWSFSLCDLRAWDCSLSFLTAWRLASRETSGHVLSRPLLVSHGSKQVARPVPKSVWGASHEHVIAGRPGSLGAPPLGDFPPTPVLPVGPLQEQRKQLAPGSVGFAPVVSFYGFLLTRPRTNVQPC